MRLQAGQQGSVAVGVTTDADACTATHAAQEMAAGAAVDATMAMADCPCPLAWLGFQQHTAPTLKEEQPRRAHDGSVWQATGQLGPLLSLSGQCGTPPGEGPAGAAGEVECTRLELSNKGPAQAKYKGRASQREKARAARLAVLARQLAGEVLSFLPVDRDAWAESALGLITFAFELREGSPRARDLLGWNVTLVRYQAATGQLLRRCLSQKEQPSTKEVVPTFQATVRWPTIGASQRTTDAHAWPRRPPHIFGELCRRPHVPAIGKVGRRSPLPDNQSLFLQWWRAEPKAELADPQQPAELADLQHVREPQRLRARQPEERVGGSALTPPSNEAKLLASSPGWGPGLATAPSGPASVLLWPLQSSPSGGGTSARLRVVECSPAHGPAGEAAGGAAAPAGIRTDRPGQAHGANGARVAAGGQGRAGRPRQEVAFQGDRARTASVWSPDVRGRPQPAQPRRYVPPGS